MIRDNHSNKQVKFYFGPEAEASRFEEPSINYVSIEEVFKTLMKYPYSSYYDMIREMLLNPRKNN